MAFGKIVKKDVERAVCASSGFGRVYEVDSLENLYCWWHGEWRSSPMV